MLADARLVAAKDLRVEWRSKVAVGQTVPFAILILVLFGFALDPDRGVLDRATAGLYWVAVLFSAVVAIQRSFAVEAAPGVAENLRLSGMDPAGMFLGKFAAVAVQLVALQVVLTVGVLILYGLDVTATVGNVSLFVAASLSATAGIAAAGTLYGVLAAGLRVRDTLVPLLLLPVLAPVLLGATRATEAALQRSVDNGWGWCGFLAVFGVLYVGAGLMFFGTLLEES